MDCSYRLYHCRVFHLALLLWVTQVVLNNLQLKVGFWPEHKRPKDAFHRIYEGGIIVPLLIGMLLMVIIFLLSVS